MSATTDTPKRGRGRPRVADKRKPRTIQANDAEWAWMLAEAKGNSKTVSAYARDLFGLPLLVLALLCGCPTTPEPAECVAFDAADLWAAVNANAESADLNAEAIEENAVGVYRNDTNIWEVYALAMELQERVSALEP